MKAIYIEHHGAIEELRASEVPVLMIGSTALKPPKIAERYKPSEVREAYGRVASGRRDKVVFVPG